MALDNENREKNLAELRKQSRRQYLTKRKEDKMLELKDDIADDEFLFDDPQLLNQAEILGAKLEKRLFWI